MKRAYTKDELIRTADSVKESLDMHENTQVSILIRKKLPKMPDFVMLFQEVLYKLMTNDISLSTCKVLLFIMANMEYQNYIGIDLKSISEKIGMPLRSVERAMKELKELNVVLSIKDKFDKRRNVYVINPLTAWKGKAHNRAKAIKAINKNQLDMFNTSDKLMPENPTEKTSEAKAEDTE